MAADCRNESKLLPSAVRFASLVRGDAAPERMRQLRTNYSCPTSSTAVVVGTMAPTVEVSHLTRVLNQVVFPKYSNMLRILRARYIHVRIPTPHPA